MIQFVVNPHHSIVFQTQAKLRMDDRDANSPMPDSFIIVTDTDAISCEYLSA